MLQLLPLTYLLSQNAHEAIFSCVLVPLELHFCLYDQSEYEVWDTVCRETLTKKKKISGLTTLEFMII